MLVSGRQSHLHSLSSNVIWLPSFLPDYFWTLSMIKEHKHKNGLQHWHLDNSYNITWTECVVMSVIDRSMENLRRILSQSSSGRRVSSPKPDAECAQFTSPSIVSSVSVKNSADSEVRPGIKDQETKKVCTYYHNKLNKNGNLLWKCKIVTNTSIVSFRNLIKWNYYLTIKSLLRSLLGRNYRISVQNVSKWKKW